MIRRSVHHLRGEESLGWGIIGASAVAARYMIPAIRAQPPIPVRGARYPMTANWIAGLYSHNERRAAAFADAHQIAHTYVNLADLLRRPNIHCIYISAHPRHHAAFALAALAAGKHVLCEPPLALTLEEAQTVVHTAANQGLALAVNYAHRANAAIAAMREMLREGEIGELLGGRASNTTFLRPAQQTWRLRSQGGGVLFDRGAHSIDTLRFLLRDEIAAIDSYKNLQVFSARDNEDIASHATTHEAQDSRKASVVSVEDVEEDVLTRITFRRSKHTFQSHDSFVIPHQPTSLELYGAEGVLVARHCFDHEQSPELYLRRRGEDMRIRLPMTNPFAVMVDRFHAAIRQAQPAQPGGGDALATLAAVLAAHESIRRGHRVALAEKRPRFITDSSHI